MRSRQCRTFGQGVDRVFAPRSGTEDMIAEGDFNHRSELEASAFSDEQAAALARAIEGFSRAAIEEVEARMNADLKMAIQRGDAELKAAMVDNRASFERTVREQTKWFIITSSACAARWRLSSVSSFTRSASNSRKTGRWKQRPFFCCQDIDKSFPQTCWRHDMPSA